MIPKVYSIVVSAQDFQCAVLGSTPNRSGVCIHFAPQSQAFRVAVGNFFAFTDRWIWCVLTGQET